MQQPDPDKFIGQGVVEKFPPGGAKRDIVHVASVKPETLIGTQRFAAVRLDLIELTTAPPAIVEDIIFAQSLVVVYGESGCGKSFFVSHMAMYAAAGWTWAGKTTTPGAVVYVCAEGAVGFRKRMVAFRQDLNPPAGTPFYVISDAPDLGHEDGDADTLIARIREQAGDNIALVVIDTFARVMFGADENSAKDVSVAVSNAAKITKTIGATVILVHHSGKNAAQGARGSSALKAASDTEILIEKTEGGRTATITKSKDAEGGLTLSFDLQPIEIANSDGDTSCIVVAGAWKSSGAAAKTRPLPKGKKAHLLQIIKNTIADHGQPSPGGDDLPAGVTVVSRERVRQEAQAAQFGGADCAPNSFRAQLSSALSGLAGDSWIGQRGDFVWVVK